MIEPIVVRLVERCIVGGRDVLVCAMSLVLCRNVAILYDVCGARSFIWRGSAVHDGGGVLDWRQTNLVSCLSGAGTGSSVGHCIADAGVLVRNGAFIFDGNRA